MDFRNESYFVKSLYFFFLLLDIGTKGYLEFRRVSLPLSLSSFLFFSFFFFLHEKLASERG